MRLANELSVLYTMSNLSAANLRTYISLIPSVY